MSGQTRSFDEPDEVIEVEKVRSVSVNIGGMSVTRDTHQPGWRWSQDLRPLVGTEWCETHHLGFVLKGQLHILMNDGTEFDCRAGDLLDVPPGHDGWVVGEEQLETLSWLGGRTWLSPLHTLKERILVTLLFTDIVDSTGVARRLGDAHWTELLRNHNQVMADQVDRHSGQIVKLTGDGVLAIFDGAARAIRCALACRRDVQRLGLQIRAAVHTGEIESPGEEIHGLAVHEAARIMSHAQGDEVLVSDLTRALARDPLLRFEDRGEVELRGLDAAVHVHAASLPN